MCAHTPPSLGFFCLSPFPSWKATSASSSWILGPSKFWSTLIDAGKFLSLSMVCNGCHSVFYMLLTSSLCENFFFVVSTCGSGTRASIHSCSFSTIQASWTKYLFTKCGNAFWSKSDATVFSSHAAVTTKAKPAWSYFTFITANSHAIHSAEQTSFFQCATISTNTSTFECSYAWFGWPWNAVLIVIYCMILQTLNCFHNLILVYLHYLSTLFLHVSVCTSFFQPATKYY